MDRIATDLQPSKVGKRSQAAVIAVVCLGAAFAVSALAANQPWLDRHFLPSFFVPRSWYVLIERIVRLVIGTVGVLLVFVAPRVGPMIQRSPARVAHVGLAVVLALGMSELVLSRVH